MTMTWPRVLSLGAFTLALLSQSPVANAQAIGVAPQQIKNLVTFGDSYTDVGNAWDGGIPWPGYVAQYTGVNLYPYARSGAVCSINITYNTSPALFESQLPQYFSDQSSSSTKLDPQSTLYTLWIGTNDVGVNSLISGSNNATIVDVAGCMINWVKVLYQSGARNFLFQNMIPLETTPLYAPYSWPNRFWSLPRNTNEWSIFMRELTLTGNALTKAYLQALAPTLPGAHIGILDSHSLFSDIYHNPQLYLNGTAPLNVTGAIRTCVYALGESTSDAGSCSMVQGTDADSYLWHDELHPSEQTDRVVAKQVSQALQGQSNQWTTWLS